jgi:hypothetical protein
MSHVHQTAGIDNVKNRIIQAKRCLIFGVAVVLLGKGEHFDLNSMLITTNLMKQLMIMMRTDIALPFKIISNRPFICPSIL